MNRPQFSLKAMHATLFAFIVFLVVIQDRLRLSHCLGELRRIEQRIDLAEGNIAVVFNKTSELHDSLVSSNQEIQILSGHDADVHARLLNLEAKTP